MANSSEFEGPMDPASRRVGSILDGKWTLVRLLGVGGMAAVYAATHRNGARAAIKLFPFSVTTSAEFAERILREGYLANKIGHPAVVRVLDDHLDREREFAYLVMELLEGETARQRIERSGPMSPIEALDTSIELVECLGAAHEKGVVHRDIKPENLFLTTEGALKVLDFGVARALDGTSSSVTRTGAMLGTPAYMSPEQARGRPSEISQRSDIYSAGATLLFLVSGDFMHEGESAQEIMVRAAWTPAKKISERGLGLPAPVARVIDAACAFDPVERYQTAEDMRQDLARARKEIEGNPVSNRPIQRVVRLPPAATVPLELKSRPRNAELETVADHTPPPDAASIRKGTPWLSERRRVIAVGVGGAILAGAAVSLILGGSAKRDDRAATAPSAEGSALSAAAGPPPVVPLPAPVEAPALAPAPDDSSASNADSVAAAHPAASHHLHPGAHPAHSSAGSPSATLAGGAAPATSQKPASALPTASRSVATRPAVGRDVGY